MRPVEARGEFGTIATRLPGVRVCEHLPRIANCMDRIALVRSMTHHYPTHAVAYALSGVPLSDPSIEGNAREPRHWPYLGSTLDYLWSRQARSRPAMPRNLYLPWPLNSRTKNAMHGGLHAAWLGSAFDPVIPQFAGQACREQGAPSADGNRAIRSQFDPFDGITADSKFSLPATESDAGNARRSGSPAYVAPAIGAATAPVGRGGAGLWRAAAVGLSNASLAAPCPCRT